jgi:acyl-CoA reductase-like NAD-dependent aldehyde dehydrogenase
MNAANTLAEIRIKNPDKLYIGGQWVPAAKGGQLQIISPNTEQSFTEVAEATEEDVDRAVAAAREAFDHGPWPRTSAAERVKILERMTEVLRRRAPELASAVTQQVGATVGAGEFLTGQGIAHYERAAQLGREFAFEQRVESPLAAAAYVVREPLGVVAAIAPWNAPFMLMSAKVASALLAGCTIIMKPASETPLEAYIIAEAAEEAGLPAGVLNLLPAGREVSDYLVRQPAVDKISFTGSSVVGRHIASIAGSRLARATMELGGKSAAIVLDDYDIEAAAKVLAGTITILTGQVCSMLTRVIVSRERHDALAEAIAAEMTKVQVGYSWDPDSQMGPIAMRRQLDRVLSYVEKGRAEGATLVTGGKRPSHLKSGYFIEPTLFAGVDSRMTIAQEEIFGPVLSLIPSEDVDDAIRIANDTIYGLDGSVLTHDAQAAYKIARQIRTGNVGQNGLRNDFALPFGGFKQSGIGREGGAQGLSSYLESKVILLDAPVHL